MIFLDQEKHLLRNIILSQCRPGKIHGDRHHRQAFHFPSVQCPADLLENIEIQIVGKPRLIQKIDISLRIHDPQILVVVAHYRLRTGHLSRLHIDLRHKTYDKIPVLKIIEQILLDDRLVMPFPQILVILLLLIAHHVLSICDEIADIDIHLLPGVSDGHESQADIVKLLMCRMHLFCEIIISTVLDQDKILIPCQPVHGAAAEILLQHFPDTGHHLVSVITSEFFVEILQAVDIHRDGSDRLQAVMLSLIHIRDKTVPVQKPCQIIVIAQIFLLLLHLLECDRLRDIRNQRTHQVQVASAPVDSHDCQDRRGVFIQLLKNTVAVRGRICDLLLHPLRLLIRRQHLELVPLPRHIFSAPFIDGHHVIKFFLDIISVLCIVVITHCAQHIIHDLYERTRAVVITHEFSPLLL